MRVFLSILVPLLYGSVALGGVTFSTAPTAKRKGDQVEIAFAVSAATDVEVSVVGPDGKAVRHLAAGLIGSTNVPPEPFKAGLTQTLVWDGKDDAGVQCSAFAPGATADKSGFSVQAGASSSPTPDTRLPAVAPGAKEGNLTPLRVRVRAGMSAAYAGTAFGSESKPDDLTNVIGLGMGPGGRVYVLSERWKRAWWTHTAIHVFRRTGEYEKTIKPFPSSLPADKVAKITKVQDDQGRPLPTIYRILAIDYYPTEDVPQHLAVTPDGNAHLAVIRAAYYRDREEGERYLASIGPDGSVPYDTYAGPKFAGEGTPGDPYLAASSDGKAVFVTGIDRAGGDESKSRPNGPVLYRVELPARSDAKPFFGEQGKATNDTSHLSDPRGVAADGKGRVLVADCGNNRVVILDEKDGKWVGSFEVKAPTWLGVHRGSGAIYVASEDAVIKLALEADGKATEKGRLALPAMSDKEKKSNRWCFALDSEADPAVLWVGHNRGGDTVLTRCEEKDGKFGPLAKAGCRPARNYWNVATGYDGKTVACKVGWHNLRFEDEDTGQTRDISVDDSGGQTYRLGPNNQVYGIDHWRWGVRRWTSEGKALPFPATLNHADKEGQGRLTNAPSGTTSWERDFDVDRSGNVYVKHRGKIYHGRMRVDKYDKDGNFLSTVVWVVSDGAHGPRVDAAGNIYIADAVKPAGQPYPEFFKGKLLDAKIDKRGSPAQQYTWMYGSVIKFGPAGGAIWFPILADDFVYAFDGEAKLPAGQPKVKIDTITGDRKEWAKEGELQGALWYRYGVSYVLDMHPGHNRRCHCTATEFDVDDYGRTFYTDQGRFRVVVLDSAGNEILAFGSYGNQDSCGPDSYVADPKGGFLRPRGKDDPADLKSPFAAPEIAFNWFTGLGVSDRYVYAADGGNRRVVRAALKYAAEETCEIK